jgi:hypothetical protein
MAGSLHPNQARGLPLLSLELVILEELIWPRLEL